MQIEDLLQEEELMVRDTVREFVDKEVMPITEEWFIKGRFPDELGHETAKMVVLGAILAGYGCSGLSNGAL